MRITNHNLDKTTLRKTEHFIGCDNMIEYAYADQA